MDRFQEMQAFVAVVEAGSFVGAADALDVSKTAVSRLVGDLEARLGVRLLHRTTRKLSLTREGEIFTERCRALLSEVAEAEAEITAHADEAIGQLRINVPMSFGLIHLAPLWPAFLAMHPKVVLEVNLSDRLVDLVDEGYEWRSGSPGFRARRWSVASWRRRAWSCARRRRTCEPWHTEPSIGPRRSRSGRVHPAVDRRDLGVHGARRTGQRESRAADANQQR